MAKIKEYRVVDKVGVVGFKGVIHKNGDVITAADAPQANLRAWLRFGQVEEVASEQPKSKGGGQKPEASETEAASPPKEKNGKK